MNTNETPRTDSNTSNTGNNGFIWSSRLAAFAGIALAVALAVARWAPVLAAGLEWQF